MGALSDQELVAALADDPAAFEEFYVRHVGKVVGAIVRRVGDPSDVADLVASTFLRVAESADRFDPDRGHPVAWLYGIAAITVADHRRHAAREAAATARLSGRRLLSADDYVRLEERIDAARLARRLYEAIEDLPPSERQLLELVSLDGMTPSQAARVLGIQPSAARMRLARARRKARRFLASDPADAQRPPLAAVQERSIEA